MCHFLELVEAGFVETEIKAGWEKHAERRLWDKLKIPRVIPVCPNRSILEATFLFEFFALLFLLPLLL